MANSVHWNGNVLRMALEFVDGGMYYSHFCYESKYTRRDICMDVIEKQFTVRLNSAKYV